MHAVTVGILLENEAHENSQRYGGRRSRDWNARYNKLIREQREIRRIKDEGERKAPESAWQTAFDALSADLDQWRDEMTELYQQAAKIPGG